MSDQFPIFPPSYDSFLRDLKNRIRTAQVRAALAVNQELILALLNADMNRRSRLWPQRAFAKRPYPKIISIISNAEDSIRANPNSLLCGV